MVDNKWMKCSLGERKWAWDKICGVFGKVEKIMRGIWRENPWEEERERERERESQ